MGIRELHPDLAKKAREELNEDPARIPKDLEAIKVWLNKQPHLNARLDDQWLLSFLRGCKYSLERTKEKLDMYYTLKSAAPEISECPDPFEPWVQDLLKAGFCVPLLKTAKPDEPRVVIIRPGTYDPSKIPTINTLRVNEIFAAIQLMEDDQSVIAGQHYIIDLSNVTMGHFTQMTPTLIKKMVASGQDALPIRQKGTHHVHYPPGSETIFAIFKRFMNEKNRNRVFMHNEDMESLYKHVPKSILPSEYGGDDGPIQDMIDHWKTKIESYSGWLKDDKKYKSDESKRPGAPKTSETLFGIEGSFRQLNLD